MISKEPPALQPLGEPNPSPATDLGLGFALLDDGEGPALKLDALALDRLALRAAERAHASAPSGWRRTLRRPLIVSCVLASATAAAAYTAATLEVLPKAWLGDPAPTEARPMPPRRQDQRVQARAPESLEPAAVPTVTPPPPIVAPSASAERGGTHRADSPKARDRLEVASVLRKAGDLTGALRLYLEIVRDYPTSAQAQVARLAAAALELGHRHDPRAALSLYRAAEAQGGGLAAEARYGQAECHALLGQGQAERRVLENFERDFPAHPLGPIVARRLRELVP